jgi:myo-inositol 2-dehydrogenase/D-chiro-inositol 1-dehydrogenase
MSHAKLGLIGTGRIGSVHASNIAASTEAELAWVADPFVDGAQRVAAATGARATEDPAAAIAAADVDGIIIASPTPTHADLIEAAVSVGIPVLCEKPIDLDLSRVDSLAPLVEASGVPVVVGFNRRFDRDFAAARARLNAGEIGSLEQLSIISRDPEAPPAAYVAVSGGIFRDMSIHDLDMARFIAGDIVEVSATGAQLFDAGATEHGDFDTVMLTLRAASGALVSITNSRHSSVGYDQRIEVFGPDGMLSVANAPTSLLRASTATSVEAVGGPYQHFFLDRYAQAYADELSAFVGLLRGEESTLATYADGRGALALADAAQRSAETGAVVAVAP